MNESELTAEIAALIDHTPIREAEAEIEAVRARYRGAADAARAADAEAGQAYAAIPELTQRCVGGEKIASAVVAEAHARVRDADQYRGFLHDVARRLTPDENKAEARLSAAKARAYAAVLEHGADLAIAAARRADRAAGNPFHQLPDAAEFEAAHRDFQAANKIMRFALQNGARHPNAIYRDGWPTSEAAQRKLWGRELIEEKAA